MHRIIKVAASFLSISVFLTTAFVMNVGSTNEPERETKIIQEESTVESEIPISTVSSHSLPIELEEPEEEIWPYPISQEEIELIALVTMAEAEGETELGKRLVIDTILNRVDDPHFPDTVHDVIYYPNAFSCMWSERINRCYIMPEIVELVKEELLNRTNYDCVFFTAGEYSQYGVPMFQECCHYFSSYD